MSSKSEGRDAINAAKRRLTAAKRWEASTAESLEAIKKSHEDARSEVEEAESSLREAYDKYEVIDVDEDDAKPAAVGGRKRGVSLSPEPERGDEKRARTNTNASSAAASPQTAARSTSNSGAVATRGYESDSSDDVPIGWLRFEKITVEGAGTSEVNGTYMRRQSCADLPSWVNKDCPVFTKNGSWEGNDGEFLVYRHSDGAAWWLSCMRSNGRFCAHFYKNKTGQTLPPKGTWSLGPGLNGTGPAPRLKR